MQVGRSAERHRTLRLRGAEEVRAVAGVPGCRTGLRDYAIAVGVNGARGARTAGVFASALTRMVWLS